MEKLRRRLAVVVVGVSVAASAFASDSLEVKTHSGKVRGSYAAEGKVRAFKGVPYAAPPTGKLRWAAPQPAAGWKGVRAATEFGARCYQTSSYPDMVFHDPGPSEDCLTLNVWAPAGAKAGSLPVMVWIYGGGFSSGGTSEARQDGQFLARRNVVVVSMNYRLGIFGFFTHTSLEGESAQHGSGNYGLLDQAAALRWVHENIRAFGGDPGNITIFGESAGSISVSAQMASPLARGLIAKAIGESGGAFRGNALPVLPLAQVEARDAEIAQAAFGTSELGALRQLTPEQLLAPFTTGGRHDRFGMVVDGYFLPAAVEDIYGAGKQAHVPLLAGWNANEGRSPIKTADAFAAAAQKEYGERATQFLAAYAGGNDDEATKSANEYAGDKFIAFSTWRWIDAQTKTGGAPVFRYRFDLGSPGDRNHSVEAGAFHSDDIEYVFGTLDSRPGITLRAEDRALSEQVGAYWTNFARTGNPNGAGLPQWPVYTPGEWRVMHLDATSAAVADGHRDRYLFLEQGLSLPPAKAP